MGSNPVTSTEKPCWITARFFLFPAATNEASPTFKRLFGKGQSIEEKNSKLPRQHYLKKNNTPCQKASKALGKGFGGEPFFKRVSPKTCSPPKKHTNRHFSQNRHTGGENFVGFLHFALEKSCEV
ncbi:hypothetical protein [Ruminococcus sp. YE78]|uniref:hypothetical protein n=1 Tax=Ruminococcus sp. YE78 TaxID=1352374 RepID=UPI001114B2EC|nr:hypothetical protein [Ruminococcus sp. YE78]